MGAVWSDERRFQRWLDVEIAALAASVELGVVPAEALAAVRQHAAIDVARIQEIEARTHHDVLAFTESIAERVGPEARWFHHGLTSSDVVDTALALQLRDAGELLIAGLERAERATLVRAEEFRHTPTIGRTHGVHAEPTTFGLKLLGWACELRPRPRPAAGRVRGRPRRQAVRCRWHVRQQRPAAGGVRADRARTRGGGRRHTGRPARPPRDAALGAGRDRKLARPLRHGGAAPPAHRGARGAGAVRPRPEGLLGHAPQAQPDRLRAHQRPGPGAARQRDGRPRGHPALARARHLALVGRAGRAAGLDDRPRLHA